MRAPARGSGLPRALGQGLALALGPVPVRAQGLAQAWGPVPVRGREPRPERGPGLAPRRARARPCASSRN
ncbi:exported hypothetical protein [Cupriavidus necator]|uniref:Uncharacterized protein n=1 Tax=Cupriavidus necator TaxID=106590 RepID=A0A1K0IID2_CUPNE|nr:exported hypothetical protein [Cupriavidus necator]